MRGLWDNIHDKRKRIKSGSGEKMRKPGSEGAPTKKALSKSKRKYFLGGLLKKMASISPLGMGIKALKDRKDRKEEEGGESMGHSGGGSGAHVHDNATGKEINNKSAEEEIAKAAKVEPIKAGIMKKGGMAKLKKKPKPFKMSGIRVNKKYKEGGKPDIFSKPNVDTSSSVDTNVGPDMLDRKDLANQHKFNKQKKFDKQMASNQGGSIDKPAYLKNAQDAARLNPISSLIAGPADAIQRRREKNKESSMKKGGIAKNYPRKPIKPIIPQYVDSQRGKGLSAARMRALREATDKQFDEKAKRFEYTPQTKQRRFVEELKPQSQDKRRKDMVPQSQKRDDGFNYKKGGIVFNKPKRTPDHPKKSHVVIVRSPGGGKKTIRFGEQGASTSGKPKEGESAKMKAKRKSFKSRHGKNIARGPQSAAYWADKVKWEEGGVNAPKRLHFMKKGKGKYKLMKHGDSPFKKHEGSSLRATFDIQKKHNPKQDAKMAKKKYYSGGKVEGGEVSKENARKSIKSSNKNYPKSLEYGILNGAGVLYDRNGTRKMKKILKSKEEKIYRKTGRKAPQRNIFAEGGEVKDDYKNWNNQSGRNQTNISPTVSRKQHISKNTEETLDPNSSKAKIKSEFINNKNQRGGSGQHAGNQELLLENKTQLRGSIEGTNNIKKKGIVRNIINRKTEKGLVKKKYDDTLYKDSEVISGARADRFGGKYNSTKEENRLGREQRKYTQSGLDSEGDPTKTKIKIKGVKGREMPTTKEKEKQLNATDADGNPLRKFVTTIDGKRIKKRGTNDQNAREYKRRGLRRVYTDPDAEGNVQYVGTNKRANNRANRNSNREEKRLIRNKNKLDREEQKAIKSNKRKENRANFKSNFKVPTTNQYNQGY